MCDDNAVDALFSLSCTGDLRELHSFPTRRSSDLGYSGQDLTELEAPSPSSSPGGGGRGDGRGRGGGPGGRGGGPGGRGGGPDRRSTRLNSSHTVISYAVFCLKKKNKDQRLVRLGA